MNKLTQETNTTWLYVFRECGISYFLEVDFTDFKFTIGYDSNPTNRVEEIVTLESFNDFIWFVNQLAIKDFKKVTNL